MITASGPQTIEACSVIIGLPTYSENPVDISASADMTAFGVSVAEDCNFIITYEDVTSGSCPWTVTRTFTATDDCGNIGTAIQVFTIDDTTAPVITASGPQTIEARCNYWSADRQREPCGHFCFCRHDCIRSFCCRRL